MPSVTIKIGRKNDTEPLFPPGEGETLIDVGDQPIEVGILEHGMTSGATAVTFIVRLPDGKSRVFFQTSAALFRQILGALDGAEARFREAPIP